MQSACRFLPFLFLRTVTVTGASKCIGRSGTFFPSTVSCPGDGRSFNSTETTHLCSKHRSTMGKSFAIACSCFSERRYHLENFIAQRAFPSALRSRKTKAINPVLDRIIHHLAFFG